MGRRTLAVVAGWARPRLKTDLAEGIARLKQEPGNEILAHGGASFTRNLLTTGLVDELRLLVHPVVLGRAHGEALDARGDRRFAAAPARARTRAGDQP